MSSLNLQDLLVIDGHNDTIVEHIVRGRTSVVDSATSGIGHEGTISLVHGYSSRVPSAGFQIDLAQMAQVGLDAGFFAIDVHTAAGSRLAFALDGFGFLFDDLARAGSGARIVRRVDDLLAARAAGQTALILAVEHADVLEGSLNVLRVLYELGVRAIGFTHNISSRAAAGCLEARAGVGLSYFGAQLVQEMNRLGMVVDLAHVSVDAFYDALGVTTKPVIFSHGNARALCDHPRNLDDAQLKALAENGGVIGLSFVPFFVDESQPSLERFLDHVDHVVEVAGMETVGLGSDFDGGGTLLKDVTALPQVVEGLIERGYDQGQVAQFLGGNMLRVLAAAIG